MSKIATGEVFRQGISVNWWIEREEADVPGQADMDEPAFEAEMYAEWWAEAMAAMDAERSGRSGPVEG